MCCLSTTNATGIRICSILHWIVPSAGTGFSLWMQHKTLQVPLEEGQDNLHDSETTQPGQCVAIRYRTLLNGLWMWFMNRMPSSLFHKTDDFNWYLVNPIVNKLAWKVVQRTTTFQGPSLGMWLVSSSTWKSKKFSLISIHTADVMNDCSLSYLCKTFKNNKVHNSFWKSLGYIWRNITAELSDNTQHALTYYTSSTFLSYNF